VRQASGKALVQGWIRNVATLNERVPPAGARLFAVPDTAQAAPDQDYEIDIAEDGTAT